MNIDKNIYFRQAYLYGFFVSQWMLSEGKAGGSA